MAAGAGAVGERLDELVPPPWGPGRRALVAVGAGVAVALAVALALSGLVGPRLSHAPSWGGGVDATDPEALAVHRTVPLHNDGWVPVTVEAFVPPGLDDVRWGRARGLPVTLQPGETHEITVEFVVQGCAVDMGGFNTFPVRASSGLAPSRVVEVGPPVPQTTIRTVHRADDGEQLTLPAWPDQPSSWVLDSIEAPCTTPPERFDG